MSYVALRDALVRQIFTRSSSARHNMGPPHFILKHASSVTSTSGFVFMIKCDLLGVKLGMGSFFSFRRNLVTQLV